MEVVLMRHGESVNNMRQSLTCIPGGYTRLPDAPLTRRGKVQAERAAGRAAAEMGLGAADPPPSSLDIYTSDMTRAIQTGFYLAKGLREQGVVPRSTLVCVVPVPFFSEVGSDTTVSVPSRARYREEEETCGARLDPSLWQPSTWADSQRCAGDYELCQSRFVEVVLPKLRARGATAACKTLIVGHGQYLMRILGRWRNLKNTQVVHCRVDEGGRFGEEEEGAGGGGGGRCDCDNVR